MRRFKRRDIHHSAIDGPVLCRDASAVSGSGPWTWSCLGQYGGSDATDCSADIQTYTVTFQTDGNGTLEGTTPQTINYGGNTSAVTANANANYHFVNWTGTGGFNEQLESADGEQRNSRYDDHGELCARCGKRVLRKLKRRDIHHSAIDEPVLSRNSISSKRQRTMDMELSGAVWRY